MADWFARSWKGREAIGRGLLVCVELAVVLALFGWTLAGLVGYGRKTGWSMEGLLTTGLPPGILVTPARPPVSARRETPTVPKGKPNA